MSNWNCKYGDRFCNPTFGEPCKYCRRDRELDYEERRLSIQRKELENDVRDDRRREEALGEAMAAAGAFTAAHPVAVGASLFALFGAAAIASARTTNAAKPKPAPSKPMRPSRFSK